MRVGSRIRSVVISLMVVSFLVPNPLQASKLESFKEKSEKEKTRKKDEKKLSKAEEEAASIFFSIFVGIFIAVWKVNMLARYGDYPYESKDGFIKYPLKKKKKSKLQEEESVDESISSDTNEVETSVAMKPTTSKESFAPIHEEHVYTGVHRFFYFNLSLGSASINEDVKQNTLQIDGKIFPLLGLHFKLRSFEEGDQMFEIFDMGINIPIFQTNGMALDFYFASSKADGLINEEGQSSGFHLKVFPVKPLNIGIQYGHLNYQYITYEDITSRLGMLFGRFEVFISYQKISAGDANLEGGGMGVSVYL